MSHPLPMFNLAPAHAPRSVVVPRTPEEVAAAVRAAAAAGEQVHPIGAGHGWARPIEGGVALLTRELAGVQVDAAAARARVGAGTTWAQVIAAAAPHGLAPLAGSAPAVGVIGYLLGGGLSPLGRTYGWAADHVRSFEIVTGTGELVTASASSHPDLFAALLGGKHAPGVVTAAEIDMVPLHAVYGGGLFFDAADAEAVLGEWAAWSARMPDEVNTSAALLRLPDLPSVPEPLRGRCVVHVRVAIVGDESTGRALLEPIRKVARPIVDTVATLPVAAIGAVHADPEEPMPVLEAGALLASFDLDAVRALLGAAGPQVEAPLAVVEVRRLGGRLAQPPSRPDAVAGRDAAYGLFVVSAPVPELFAGPVPAAVGGLARALAPWASGRFQPNFVGALNQPTALDAAWPDEVRARLEQVRRSYDPAGVINH
ncbi:FAD-binding oxidoreductase [Nocardioides nitrophenolicus]|uniref:FAD-binding oxidoreductase n=1 Tax=Nocardioides nitrophenolicus TaxID=60489 RepID=UPI00195606B3|nr:FAD-binding protein [Nocardioides nitrophenolicus]MBM7517035.1 FAD/FMN-containing dehydrogenase [Nocardioides nitrophenolicus]